LSCFTRPSGSTSTTPSCTESISRRSASSFALVGDVERDDADAHRLPIARAQHRVQLHQHRSAGEDELDVARLARARAAQPFREQRRKAGERIVVVVGLQREAVEIRQRLVDADEAHVGVAEAEPHRHVPDRVEEAPGRVHLAHRGDRGVRTIERLFHPGSEGESLQTSAP
jgi:hypothetical protein